MVSTVSPPENPCNRPEHSGCVKCIFKPGQDIPTFPKPWRMLGDLRLGQAIINALQAAGHLRMVGGIPYKTDDGKVEVSVMAYQVKGRDLFYMEDSELIKLVRDYIVRLERQDVNRKKVQGKEDCTPWSRTPEGPKFMREMF